jgi:phosphatidylglycerophosphatase C
VSGTAQPALAVFDFDGTLTRRDTLLSFLAATCGRGPLASALARHGLLIARSAAGRGGEQAAKEALFTTLWAGRTQTGLEELVPAFADRLLARGMRPAMLERVAWHLEQGHDVAVVSASPELYVAPVARRLGITRVLGTVLQVDAAGRLTGRIAGANVKGAEKVRRLREALGPVDVGYAYGNSRGDRELLALAREPMMVGRKGRG